MVENGTERIGDRTELPLFPLDSVLFPDMLMPLHIFEPRYRLLMQRGLDGSTPFGIVLICEGEEVGPPAVPHRVGTVAEIVARAIADGRSPELAFPLAGRPFDHHEPRRTAARRTAGVDALVH